MGRSGTADVDRNQLFAPAFERMIAGDDQQEAAGHPILLGEC